MRWRFFYLILVSIVIFLFPSYGFVHDFFSGDQGTTDGATMDNSALPLDTQTSPDLQTIPNEKTNLIKTIDDDSLILSSLKDNIEISNLILLMNWDFDNAINSLNNFKGEAELLQEGDPRIQEINNEISLLLINLPKSVILKEEIEYPRVYPETINEELLSGKKEEDILAVQDDVNINTQVKLYEINDFSGNLIGKTFIRRTLESNLNEFAIIEDISKDIIQSASLINLGNSGYEIINEDPIIKWNFNNAGSLEYIIDGNVLDRLNLITTIVLSENIETGNFVISEPVCGDDTCTEILEDAFICPQDCSKKFKINYPIFGGLILVLIIGLIIIFVFTRKKKTQIQFNQPETQQQIVQQQAQSNIQQNSQQIQPTNSNTDPNQPVQ